ncbi:probable xyloglucan endotransglucosylase/hydrolase protein 10 [Ricinus communis]|uniref:Xyloglucan endotransglucosylase/hydrolase n=1 Tax=Ricinus communis TaxID=3988 RepID=B9S7W0_RICCO|nr:probable xyloglucan endotransglucosylase/hydrolase protein 10 [Ricinus communis]EEF40276.1 Xyloglucan endotransglucosylase/hydrolase protein A precursor, putative [Ricinus communis]|eukprot:XP_002522076.1 probable xyloglucan endotransglucosylase/hydrolase protein 10 [Ricinus communis]
MSNMFKFIVFIELILASLFQISFSSVVSTGDFNKDFFVSWSPSHINTSADGRTRSLELDQESGSGFDSKQMFLFGQFDMQIKLVPGNSAGTVVAFYLASDQPNRDEIDFEFLGTVPGQPYILQTNVYADGFDDREERIILWFDPTLKFHTYSVLWNIYQIVFMVDSIPIRVYRNHADKGVAYPRWQPMSIKGSIWNGENWATRGGKDKIDWSQAPFITSFSNYRIDACIWKGNPRFCRADSSTNWWNKKAYNTLTPIQRRWYKWVRLHHLIYDYCQDKQRFHNILPKECSLPKY